MKKSLNPRVFLEFQFGNRRAGVVMLELFADVVPKAAANFLGLCNGSYGLGKETREPLCYAGCKVFKVVSGQYIQTGDFQNNNGKGGESIYGGAFEDENFTLSHGCAGIVSMCNEGPNSNRSQFYITLKATPFLNKRNVVVGQVRLGMEILRAIEKLPVDDRDIPKMPVVICGCGVWDPSLLPVTPGNTVEEESPEIRLARLAGEYVEPDEPKQIENAANRANKLLEDMISQTSAEIELYDATTVTRVASGSRNQKSDFVKSRERFRATQEINSALAAEKVKDREEEKMKSRSLDFNIWNEESVLLRYSKQVNKIRAGQSLSDMLNKVRRRRKGLSPQDADKDITYINQRNKLFNKKLEKAYGTYVVDIEKNLERGTAL